MFAEHNKEAPTYIKYLAADRLSSSYEKSYCVESVEVKCSEGRKKISGVVEMKAAPRSPAVLVRRVPLGL